MDDPLDRLDLCRRGRLLSHRMGRQNDEKGQRSDEESRERQLHHGSFPFNHTRTLHSAHHAAG